MKAYGVILVLLMVFATLAAVKSSIDYEALSVPELETLANKGDAEAQGWLGDKYYFGEGVTRDYKKAVKWYLLAVDQGDSYPQYNLGNSYYFGQGVNQDYKEALKWFQLAADQGYAEAQYSLGVMYAYGQGVTQDYKEAIKLYHLSADQGYAYAQSILGKMFFNGDGVSIDYEKAYFWFLIAVENADADYLDSYSQDRDKTAAKLTTAQKNKVQQEAKAWLKEKGLE